MVNAQEWLDKNYPKEQRSVIKRLDIINYVDERTGRSSPADLTGSLTIVGFTNLESLSVSRKQLSALNVIDSPKLTRLYCGFCPQLITLNLGCNVRLTNLSCYGSRLTNLDFLDKVDSFSLTELNVGNNNFSSQDLSVFSRFVNLKRLEINNSNHGPSIEARIKQGVYNRFYGSLGYLQNLTKLEFLNISNTDVDSGLEYLPDSLNEDNSLVHEGEEGLWKWSRIFPFAKAECRPDSKVVNVERQLKNFGFRLSRLKEDYRKKLGYKSENFFSHQLVLAKKS